MLAKGWTINFESLDDLELFMPLAILIGIFKVLIIGLGKMEDNSAMFFHRYDSFIGWILVAFNFVLYVYFLIAAIASLKQSKGNQKTYSFFLGLVLYGTIYFFAFPFLMIVTLGSAPEERTSKIEVGRIFSQLIGLSVMTYVTGNKKGSYKALISFKAVLPQTRD